MKPTDLQRSPAYPSDSIDSRAPVLAIDGPAASGKGTIARLIADRLGFHYLDSGAVYRVLALQALLCGMDLTQEKPLVDLAAGLQPVFRPDGRIMLGTQDVTEGIRDESVGQAASKVAVHPALRDALLGLQRRARRTPGLVAEGRDMGTVVFPDARLKVFLTASPESRARRRHQQLLERGLPSEIPDLIEEMRERDRRDQQRPVAPLQPATGAVILDSTDMEINSVIELLWQRWVEDGGAEHHARRSE